MTGSKVKEDARGAFAPSQGDSTNDGADSANPSGDRDATRKPDDHGGVKTPKEGENPQPR